MAANTQHQQRNQTILYLVAGVIFIVLLFLLIWFMKQRDHGYAQQNTPTPTKEVASEETKKPTPAQPTPATPTPNASTPEQTPATPHSQQTTELPATGPADGLAAFLGLVVVSYATFRFMASRQAIFAQ